MSHVKASTHRRTPRDLFLRGNALHGFRIVSFRVRLCDSKRITW